MDLITDTGNPGYYLCNSCICVTVILKQIQMAKQRGHKADAQQLFPVQKKPHSSFFATDYIIKEELPSAQRTIYWV